jgi:hypothetical protein
MDESLFTGVETKEEVRLSTGAQIRLPVRYYDWSAILAHFPAPARRVQEILPSPRLKPALFLPGTAIVTLVAMEYQRVSDVAPYNEAAVMVPVLYEPGVNIPGIPLFLPQLFKRFGLYVHHLPVTTREAYDFGVEIWGYPKFIAEIEFTETTELRRSSLGADGKDIFTLEVRKWPTKIRSVNYHSYTVKGGQLLQTPVQTRGRYGIARFKGGASYTLGNHPIAEELRRLGIGERALESQYAPELQSLLHPASRAFPMR